VSLFSLASGQETAGQTPHPPCEREAFPPFPRIGMPANAQAWWQDDLPGDWAIPPCVGWTLDGPAVIVALAGTFRHDGTVEDLAARLGAISTTRGIRYWSVTDDAWRVLVTEASALTASDGAPRPDFSAAEVVSGADLYFAQEDNRSSSPVTYRMRVRAARPDRLEYEVENVTSVYWHGLLVYESGDLRSAHFLARGPDDIWTYYSFGTIGEGFLSSLGGELSSHINRSVAFFRHLAGIPTDQEPPAAPD
jgi:hypothetical protein